MVYLYAWSLLKRKQEEVDLAQDEDTRSGHFGKVGSSSSAAVVLRHGKEFGHSRFEGWGGRPAWRLVLP